LIAEAVPALWIVKHFYVNEDVASGIRPGLIGLSAHPFAFEQLKEALGDSIVVTIPRPAHALLQIMYSEEIFPIIAADGAMKAGFNRDFPTRSRSEYR